MKNTNGIIYFKCWICVIGAAFLPGLTTDTFGIITAIILGAGIIASTLNACNANNTADDTDD